MSLFWIIFGVIYSIEGTVVAGLFYKEINKIASNEKFVKILLTIYAGLFWWITYPLITWGTTHNIMFSKYQEVQK